VVAVRDGEVVLGKVDERLESVIAGVDVFGVCETLCNQVNLKRLEGYHHHGLSTECRILDGAMSSRGISLYWRTDLQIRVTPIPHELQDPDVVWISLAPHQARPVFLACFYAPQSADANADAAYTRLGQQIASFQEREVK
jgi:hypothetical protein